MKYQIGQKVKYFADDTEEWFDGVLISTTEIVIPIGSFGGCWVDCDGGD